MRGKFVVGLANCWAYSNEPNESESH